LGARAALRVGRPARRLLDRRAVGTEEVASMSREANIEVVTYRAPSPGVAAVLSVLIPGLGHVYAGRVLAGLLWFAAASFGYWAILVPGFLIHVASVWFAYRSAKGFTRY